MKIIVIGGSGLVGTKVVKKLTEAGHEAVAASPRSGINTITGEGLVEVLIRQNLRASNDPREVVTDPHARYFGEELSERSLVPDKGARLGQTRFAEWLKQSTFRAHA